MNFGMMLVQLFQTWFYHLTSTMKTGNYNLYKLQTLVLMWNSALPGKFNFIFQEFFASISKTLILGERLGTSLWFY